MPTLKPPVGVEDKVPRLIEKQTDRPPFGIVKFEIGCRVSPWND
jgi:hypothetical protein